MRAFTHGWAGLLPLLAGLAACGGGPMAAMDDTPYFVARGRYPARDKLPTLTEDADHVLRGQGFVDIGALYVDGVGTGRLGYTRVLHTELRRDATVDVGLVAVEAHDDGESVAAAIPTMWASLLL